MEENIQVNILIVEDDRVSQLFLRNVLEGEGLTVRIAENGQQALDELDTKHFDAILMDIQMPIMDGLETTRRIRAAKNTFNKIPIIAITSYAMEEGINYFLASGMDDYVPKLAYQEDIIAAIRRYLPA